MKRLFAITCLALALALAFAGPFGQVLADWPGTAEHGEHHGQGGHSHDSVCLTSPSCGINAWSLADPHVIRSFQSSIAQNWPCHGADRLRSVCLDPDTPPPRIVF